MNAENRLRQDIRMTAGEAGSQINPSSLSSAIRRAKKHIRTERNLEADFNWFDSENPQREQAIFWYGCLFVKVQAGELDSQTVSVGSIDANKLLAKDNNTETIWFRNARQMMRSIATEEEAYGQYGAASRPGRRYEGGSGSGIETGSETEVDGL